MDRDKDRPHDASNRNPEWQFREAIIAQQRMLSPEFGRHLGGVMIGDLGDYTQQEETAGLNARLEGVSQQIIDAMAPVNVDINTPATFAEPLETPEQEETLLPTELPTQEVMLELPSVELAVPDAPPPATVADIPEQVEVSMDLPVPEMMTPETPPLEQVEIPEFQFPETIQGPPLRLEPVMDDLTLGVPEPPPTPVEAATGVVVTTREPEPVVDNSGTPIENELTPGIRQGTEYRLEVEAAMDEMGYQLTELLQFMTSYLRNTGEALRRLHDDVASEGQDVE